MRIRWFFPALLVILASSPVFGLTVSDVVEMTQAGLGDEVIINQIRATNSRFDLTVDDIVALHNVGVSDPVLSFMITTAFDDDPGTYGDDYGTTYTADDYDDYIDDYGTTYTVLRDPEPEVHTYVHLGLGYYNSPWTCLWWDYWWPDWDYYWYAGTYCGHYWSWRYRPWYYHDYCWHYHRCGPSYGWRVWDDCGPYYCSTHRDYDRVRWKSSTPPRRVSLASSHTRTKAIKDAAKGRLHSPLAQLEPQRTKSTKYRSGVLTKGARGATAGTLYGQTPKSKSRAALVHSNKKRAVSTGQSVTSPRSWTRSKTKTKSGAAISRTGRSKAGSRSPTSIRPTKRRSSSPSITSSKRRSSRSSGSSSKSSIRSGSSSRKSSPARSSGNRSSSKSKSSRSSGSKGSKKKR